MWTRPVELVLFLAGKGFSVVTELRATAATFSRGTSYVAEAEKPSEGLDVGEDLFDLFTEEDEIDESLMMLTSSLDDVDINELLEQVCELQDIMDERR